MENIFTNKLAKCLGTLLCNKFPQTFSWHFHEIFEPFIKLKFSKICMQTFASKNSDGIAGAQGRQTPAPTSRTTTTTTTCHGWIVPTGSVDVADGTQWENLGKKLKKYKKSPEIMKFNFWKFWFFRLYSTM